MNNLVIGLGEVGKSLQEVLKCEGVDKTFSIEGYTEFLHICFPYSDKFEESVKEYQQTYQPKITVIHSTIPVGISRKLGAVHSPIHGIHPNLAQSIKTFVKFIGAEKREDAEAVLRLYQEHGIKGYIVKNPETSELSKLGCTTRHGLMIIEQKLFKKMCEEQGADFDEAYTLWNGEYTRGYHILGLPYVQRSMVRPMEGKIGGHCIIPNLEMIGGDVAEFIKKENDKL